jgi:hypothetical protein
MSPNNNNNKGGRRARAASGGTTTRDVARAGELNVLIRGVAMLALSLGILIAYAPELWPGLFGTF